MTTRLALKSPRYASEDDLHEQRWLPVVDYEGLYEVSDQGRVRSLPRTIRQMSRWGTMMDRRVRGCLLKPCHSGSGLYFVVSLARDGVETSARISRIVLTAFVGPVPSPEHQSAHGNGNRLDNRLINLRWATPAENTGDRVDHGTSPVGEQNPAAKISASQVSEIRAAYRAGQLTQVELARAYGLGQSHISRITRGESWAE